MMNLQKASALTGALAALLLSACGGGGGVDDPATASAMAAGDSARTAAAMVDMEGCVVDHNFVPHSGSVRALRADGRLLASAHTNANGVFVLRVPAQTTLKVELEAPDAQGIEMLTGRSNFSVGACWIDVRAAYSGRDDAVDATLPESVAMPVIRSQPQALSVAAGQPARFSVTAEWRKPLRYQWRRNGADVAGATGPSLTLAAAQAADQAEYSVVVSNSFASIASKGAQLELSR
jgi:hypothetical protein